LSSIQRFSSLAFSLLFNAVSGTAMLRITVAFIVVTLTGLPVLPAMCHAWCGEDKATNEYCHDEAVENGSATLITERAAICTALVTDDPFIREDARPVFHTVQPLLAVRMMVPRPTSPARAFIARLDRVSPGAPAPPLVLRV
jgi:hypothetical protein